jgi:hypothetical protein
LLTVIATKIKFPTIKGLLQITGFVKILKAELILKPVKYSYTNYPLPLQVEPVNIDASNTINTSLGAYDANGGFIPQTGDLTIDNVYNENTFYTYDVTTFLQTQINTIIDNKNGLTFLPDNYQKTLSRIVIGDQQNTNGKMQLKLNYISINK